MAVSSLELDILACNKEMNLTRHLMSVEAPGVLERNAAIVSYVSSATTLGHCCRSVPLSTRDSRHASRRGTPHVYERCSVQHFHLPWVQITGVASSLAICSAGTTPSICSAEAQVSPNVSPSEASNLSSPYIPAMLSHSARLLLSCARPGLPALTTRFLASSASASQLQVLVEPLGHQNEGISVVTLNRPASRNALGHQLIRELQEAIDTLRQERTTRCVLLRSVVPGIFCAGAGQVRL